MYVRATEYSMPLRLALMLSFTLVLAAPAAAAWRPDGNPVAIVRGIAGYVRAVSDGAGGSYFAWKQLGPTVGDTSYVGPDLDEPASVRWAVACGAAAVSVEGDMDGLPDRATLDRLLAGGPGDIVR